MPGVRELPVGAVIVEPAHVDRVAITVPQPNQVAQRLEEIHVARRAVHVRQDGYLVTDLPERGL